MAPTDQQDLGPDTVPRLHRWTIDRTSGHVRSEPLDDRVADFPRVDERRLGLKHRYGYLASAANGFEGAPTFSQVYKYDHASGRSESHDFGDANGCGEAVFIPRTAAAPEDDGYLMTFVYDAARDTSELVLLNAQHIADTPIARVRIPHRVPYGFHGNWVPAT